MEKEHVDLVRYLVVDKGMPLAGEKEMNMSVLIRLLDKILRTVPSASLTDAQSGSLHNPSMNGSSSSTPGAASQTQSRIPEGATSRSSTYSPPTPLQSQMISGGLENSASQQSEASWRADEALAYELSQQELRHDGDSEGSVEDAVGSMIFR